jgi:phage terminase large subunit GpA-like protein
MNWFNFFKPPEKLNVSKWADKYRMLSPESSSEPGRWNTSRAEYQRGIMNAFNDPKVEEIVWMSSAQVGKTEALLNIIGFFIDKDASPILVLQPTLEMAKTFSKDRLSTMLRDTPSLKGKVKDAKGKNSDNTILHKVFPGGHITIAGANSPASLASRPIRIVLLDEVDRYPLSAGSEGDPVNLAIKRTTTFWNRKVMLASTPTIKGISRIEKEFEKSDKRMFYVPCPDCGEYQVLKWGNVVWENDKPETAKYSCEKCGSLWNDTKRYKAIKKGEWRATAEFKGIAGFWLNEIYSPWVKLSDMTSNFLNSKDDIEQLKTFVNTSLGEPWEDRSSEEIEWQKLYLERESYIKVPARAAVLVCGVDTQDDRLEGEIRAFGKGEESWGIKRFIIYGSPALDSTWEQLDDIILADYESELGIKLRVSCTCIDSGGHFTDEVYRYCKDREIYRVFAIKGANTPAKPIISRPSKNNRYKVNLFTIGTDTAKELIYARLKLEDVKQGYYHWNENYDEEYFKQIVSEKPVTKYKKGVPYREWVKMRPRNEALDYNVYALAAVRILNPNYDAILQTLTRKKEAPKKTQKIKKSNWTNSWKGF